MGKKRKKKKSSAKWFRPVLPVKKAQEKKIWRGECSNVPKKSKSGVGKKKSCVPCACGASMYPTNVDHQQNIFKIGNPSGEPESSTVQSVLEMSDPFVGVRGGPTVGPPESDSRTQGSDCRTHSRTPESDCRTLGSDRHTQVPRYPGTQVPRSRSRNRYPGTGKKS